MASEPKAVGWRAGWLGKLLRIHSTTEHLWYGKCWCQRDAEKLIKKTEAFLNKNFR